MGNKINHLKSRLKVTNYPHFVEPQSIKYQRSLLCFITHLIFMTSSKEEKDVDDIKT